MSQRQETRGEIEGHFSLSFSSASKGVQMQSNMAPLTVTENASDTRLTTYLNPQTGDRHRSLWAHSFPRGSRHLQQRALPNQTD